MTEEVKSKSQERRIAVQKEAPKELTLYEKLSTPITKEFLIEYTEDGKTFTGYQSQYAINLLNKVVGLGEWVTEETILQQEAVKGGFLTAMKVVILIKPDIMVTGYGASVARRVENAYKGAKTSAFKNACRYLGIGNELYLGIEDDDMKSVPAAVEVEAPKKEAVVIADEAQALLEQLKKAASIQELDGLAEQIKLTKSEAIRSILIKAYNDKKIQLS